MIIPKITASVVLGAFTLALSAPADAHINQRQNEQRARILNGINSGRLTHKEIVQLQQQQASIARYEAQSRRDGFGLSRYERQRISQMQNQANRTIYRQKHDRQYRR